jgi:putative glutamine amidotransferase
MTSPLIGITTNQTNPGIKTDSLSSAYTNAVRNAGGLPLLIPNTFSLGQIDSLLTRLGGIIFSGGGDVDISLFNGEYHSKIGTPSLDRDNLEIAIIRKAIQIRLPTLGICRGIQVINIALGGTLYTHLPAQYKTTLQHATPRLKGRDYMAHEVKMVQGSRLMEILGSLAIPVNSFHHQAIKDLAPQLKVTGRATDGLIEGVELIDQDTFVIGVQWHPECLPDRPEQQQLFKSFVEVCNR